MQQIGSPLVTVVIPSYNAECWIQETIKSALAQTYSNLEIIVVDDCSKDGTRAILASFKHQIRVIENTVNQGVSAARNSAILASRGSYIAFLDHDDWWRPDKLTKQMSLFIQDRTLGLVYSDALYETKARRWRSFQINSPFRKNAFDQLLLHNFILCLTAVVPRHVLEQVGVFRPELHCAQDYDLFLRIAERFPIDYIDEPLATFRVHDRNFSRHRDMRYGEWLGILDRYKDRPGLYGLKAMTFVRWGMDSWRSDKARMQGLLRILRGILMGLKDPKGFYIAFQEAWRQRYARRLIKI